MLIVGLPGIGKTCGIISSIKEMNKRLPAEKQLGFKKILLGQTVVGSLSGIPVSRPDGTVVRIQIPDLPNPERDGEYGVLFLDEITTADEMQIQPALGLATLGCNRCRKWPRLYKLCEIRRYDVKPIRSL